MSDQVTQENEKGRGSRVWRIVLFALLAVLICGAVALYVFRDELDAERFFTPSESTQAQTAQRITFDAHSANQYADLDGELAIGAVSGLRVYSISGEQTVSVNASLSTPQVLTAQKHVLAYDAGGYSLVQAHRRNGEVLNLTTSEPIVDADLAPDGSVCYTDCESGSKTVTYVYNKDQQMIYRWLSTSQFLPLCTINSGASTLACIAMGQSGGIYESSLVILRTNEEQIDTTVSLGNELIYDLEFVNDATLCAVGESSLHFLSSSGTRLGKYDYTDAYLKDFSLEGDGFLTLTLNMYKAGNRYSVVTVGYDGAELGTLSSDVQILDVSASGGYVAVLSAQKLMICDKNMQLVSEQENAVSATNVVMRDDGSALLIASGYAELMTP